MRTIKFRGHNEKGNWVYGGFFITKQEPISCIIVTEFGNEYVHPDSVGQFTGLNDKNGNEIYEGDIITVNGNRITAIMWTGHGFNGVYMNENLTWDDEWEDGLNGRIDGFEINGNIYESPDMLKNNS